MIDRALRTQSWLLSLKEPEKRPRTNMINFMHENREIFDKDAEFLSDTFRSDMVALASHKREPLSIFLGKYLFWAFESKVTLPTSMPYSQKNLSNFRVTKTQH